MTEAATAIAAAVLLTVGSLTPESGIASQYSEGVMQTVIANRQRMGQLPAVLPAVDGFIAVSS